jgi:uncharacterized FlaG/YvyC family protein
VQGSQAASTKIQSGSGNSLPPSGRPASSPAAASGAGARADEASASTVAKATVQGSADTQSLVNQLNKYLNDSGRPDQFRVDPASGGKLIQQVNPESGAVVGEFSATEFPALARSVGVSGLLIDSRA